MREVYPSAWAFPLPDVITRIELLARARLETRRLGSSAVIRTRQPREGSTGPRPFELMGTRSPATPIQLLIRAGQDWDVRRGQIAQVEAEGTVTAFAGSTVFAEAGSTVYAYSDTIVHLPAVGEVRLMAHANATILREQ